MEAFKKFQKYLPKMFLEGPYDALSQTYRFLHLAAEPRRSYIHTRYKSVKNYYGKNAILNSIENEL